LKNSISLERALADAATRSGRFLSEHPRSLAGAVALALAGFGVTAFGLAGPDASDLPTRVVTETVTPSGVAEQLDTLAVQSLALYRSDVTRNSDTADSLLRRLGVAACSKAVPAR
jgi:hypothetical protein